MDTIAVRYEQRVYLTRRQVRCCVNDHWSEWRDLTVEDARALDAEAAVGDGGCIDVEAMFRVARNCFAPPQAIEGVKP